MAVVYQNKSEVSVGTNETSITIPVPAGFSAGDLLIACIVMDNSSSTYYHNTPTGWTLLQKSSSGGTRAFGVWYRIAEEGDTEWTWTINLGGSFQQYGVILRYTGQAESGFIHDSDMTISDVSTLTPTAPDVSYTDLEEGSLCLQVFGADDDDTPYTTPVQLTERYNDVSNTGAGTCGGAGGDKAISGTGSTGTAEFTMEAVEQWVAVTVVIEAQRPPVTHEIAGVINGVSQIVGESTVIGTYIFDFSEDDGNWTLSDSTISGGVLEITALGGYGQRSPDVNWYSNTTDDFILEVDFKADTADVHSCNIQLYLVDDAIPILFFVYGPTNIMVIKYDEVEKAQQAFVDDTNWHTVKIRRVGTTYYYSIDGGDEISWDYGTERALNYFWLLMAGCTGDYDNFKYYPVEIGGIHFIKAIVNGISTITGNTFAIRKMVGTINAISQITGKLVGFIFIGGQIQALSEVNGQIVVSKYLSGSINALSQVDGKLTGVFYLEGIVKGQSTVKGLPHIIRFLKGTIAGKSVIIGILQDADKWSKPDRDTSQFSKTTRDDSSFSKTSRDASTFNKEER